MTIGRLSDSPTPPVSIASLLLVFHPYEGRTGELQWLSYSRTNTRLQSSLDAEQGEAVVSSLHYLG